ncbi:SIMPL domain-containing protein [Blastococcus sp. TF02A-30]|uniref:SIMPL domain-containing protein n=1 Tax=Blastococcus sp. TF02A-30 TaxID=2250580 RepID=UPI000DE8653B|nr:SIMPL domain-containing protein [Blastococcus sp. TF02A-30]RBY89314.1 SIMPL domain-containing protein [Blastococcus sp. TF02A-30]
MSEPDPQVVVRGEALVVVDPEVADLGITVRARARDRESALQRCAARQQEVRAVLDATADLEAAETAGVAVHPEAPDGGLPASVATVHTRVTVAPGAVGDLVVALARLDDVEVSGPVWRLRPGSPAVERARLAAVDDAVHRARQYAAAFGARLSAVREIRDVGLSDARVAGAVATMARFEVSELRLDLTPARQDVHGAVEVRFAMTEPDAALWNPEEPRP